MPVDWVNDIRVYTVGTTVGTVALAAGQHWLSGGETSGYVHTDDDDVMLGDASGGDEGSSDGRKRYKGSLGYKHNHPFYSRSLGEYNHKRSVKKDENRLDSAAVVTSDSSAHGGVTIERVRSSSGHTASAPIRRLIGRSCYKYTDLYVVADVTPWTARLMTNAGTMTDITWRAENFAGGAGTCDDIHSIPYFAWPDGITSGPSGTGAREGNCIVIRGLEFRGNVYETASGAANTFVRMIIYQMRQRNYNNQTTAAEVLTQPAGNLLGGQIVMQNKTQYNILHDKTVPLIYGGTNGTNSAAFKINLNFPGGFEVQYNALDANTTPDKGFLEGGVAQNDIRIAWACVAETGLAKSHKMSGNLRFTWEDGVV